MMKTNKGSSVALNVSPVRMFRAFMADKVPHSWCGAGISLPGRPVESKAAAMPSPEPRSHDPITDETEPDRSHNNRRGARSPPCRPAESCWKACLGL